MRCRRTHSVAGDCAPGQFSERCGASPSTGPARVYAVGDSDGQGLRRGGRACCGQWADRLPGDCVAVDHRRTRLGRPAGSGREPRCPRQGLADTWRDAGRLGLVTAIGFDRRRRVPGRRHRRCIRRYDRSGRIARRHRQRATAREGFLIPNGVWISRSTRRGSSTSRTRECTGSSDTRLDGESARAFRQVRRPGPGGLPGCCNPTNMALHADGDVVVTEKAPPRVKIYEPGLAARHGRGRRSVRPALQEHGRRGRLRTAEYTSSTPCG